jgi:hypothetical protein
VGPRAGLDTEVRGKILCPCWGSNPDLSVVQSLDTILTELRWLLKEHRGNVKILIKFEYVNTELLPVWWPGLMNSPTVTHACCKR